MRKVWRGSLVLVAWGILAVGAAWGQNDPDRFNAVLEQTTAWYGNSVEDVVRRLGKPQREEAVPDVSPHDPNYRFEWVHLYYEDREVVLFRAPDKEFLVRVETGRPEDRFGGGLAVGSSRKAVVRALGEPLDVRDGALIYQDESGYCELAFQIDARGMVRRMQLDISMD